MTALVKKLEIRIQAQDNLLYGMRVATSQASEDNGASKEVLLEMHRQYDRVAKLFGYAPGGPYFV
jgi:hypothetical protein